MARSTISETGSNVKRVFKQFSIALTPIERMFVDYYAARYGKDRIDVLRGMLRKYVASDRNFDAEQFVRWAEKTYIPAEDDKELRDTLRTSLQSYKNTVAK